MIILYDHIQDCGLNYSAAISRAAVQAALANAIAEQAEIDRAFDATLEIISEQE